MTADRTPHGKYVMDVMVATIQTYFRLTAVGKRLGAVSPWGGGTWGFLRTLAVEGPRTVPQIARSRPVTRQLIQRIANELAAQGLVEFIDNPAHKRSKLLRLTTKGRLAHDESTARIEQVADALARDMDAERLRTTAETLKTIQDKLELY
jgi:DNA-binding MarR family transcriptional regulator